MVSTLNTVSVTAMAQGKLLSAVQIFSSFTLKNCKVIGNLSWILINTESDRVAYCFGKLLCISNRWTRV